MVYMLNNNLSNDKLVLMELCKVYGIGKYQALSLCRSLCIGQNCKISDLNQLQLFQLLKKTEQKNYILGNELLQQKKLNIADLIEIKSYKGLQHVFKTSIK
jgi:ribosomal protein S13